jgi:5'-nucleotidase
MQRLVAVIAILGAAAGCQCRSGDDGAERLETPPQASEPRRLTLSIIGTNDVHGHVEMLPILGGHVANLRAAREDAGGVILLDGGDMFQGTLESNLGEGIAMVHAYEALGYDAVAIGNHEFDFGPVGPSAVPEKPGDDPRGALRRLAAEADYPFLAANLVDRRIGKLPIWDNVKASVMTRVAGIDVGIIGVSTIDTPHTTIAANFEGLAMMPLAAAITTEATRLRAAGAVVVLVAAHAGARCDKFHDPHDHSSCAPGEIVEVANQLRSGVVDVIVAGHTHAGMAHRVNGIAIIEAFALGRAFGRVDLVVADGAIKESLIFPPRFLCGAEWRPEDGKPCEPGAYEGRPVEPHPGVAAIAEAAAAMAASERERSLEVTVARKIRRAYREESALGNLFTDLMLAARPRADVALTNGGGLRADLAAGPLTYGRLYEAMPFDNRFAFVTLDAGQLADLIAANLTSSRGILSLSGIEARARCAGGELAVELRRPGGARIRRGEQLVVATSDFLASGGDAAFARLDLAEGAVELEDGEPIRDAMAEQLVRRGGSLDPENLLDRDKPRLVYPGSRPVKCR